MGIICVVLGSLACHFAMWLLMDVGVMRSVLFSSSRVGVWVFVRCFFKKVS